MRSDGSTRSPQLNGRVQSPVPHRAPPLATCARHSPATGSRNTPPSTSARTPTALSSAATAVPSPSASPTAPRRPTHPALSSHPHQRNRLSRLRTHVRRERLQEAHLTRAKPGAGSTPVATAYCARIVDLAVRRRASLDISSPSPAGGAGRQKPEHRPHR